MAGPPSGPRSVFTLRKQFSALAEEPFLSALRNENEPT